MVRKAHCVIGIEGAIGATKSTLTRQAAVQPDLKELILGLLDQNPHAVRVVTSPQEEIPAGLLEKLYGKNAARFFDMAEMGFLVPRIEREGEIDNLPGIVMIDRTYMGGKLFFDMKRGSMDPVAAAIYERLFDIGHQNVYTSPDVYVYLRGNVETLLRNITARDRPEERSLAQNPGFLAELCARYDRYFLGGEADAPVITVNIDNMNILPGGELDQEYLHRTIREIVDKIKGLNLPRLTSEFGEWLAFTEFQAGERAIKAEKELGEYLARNFTIITTAANVGLGKSTTTGFLSHALGIPASYELKNGVFHQRGKLKAFIEAPDFETKKRLCYALQVELRERRLKSRRAYAENGKSFWEDRSPEEDPLIFHPLFRDTGLLTEEGFRKLQEGAIRAYSNAPKSNLIVLLTGTPEMARQGVLERNRAGEAEMWTHEKLSFLSRMYDQFAGAVRTYGLHDGPVLTFDRRVISPVNQIHRGYMCEQILKALTG